MPKSSSSPLELVVFKEDVGQIKDPSKIGQYKVLRKVIEIGQPFIKITTAFAKDPKYHSLLATFKSGVRISVPN